MDTLIRLATEKPMKDFASDIRCKLLLISTNHVQKKKKLQIVLQKEKNKNYPEILYSGGERTWAWLSRVSNSASGAASKLTFGIAKRAEMQDTV
jgi:hypothetical protein